MDFRSLYDDAIDELFNILEEFFSYISVPTASYIVEAFIVSLGFLAVSLIEWAFELPAIVLPQEALIASILLAIVAVVDTSTRQSLKRNVNTLQKNSVRKLQEAQELIQQKLNREEIIEDGESEHGE